MKYNIFNLLNDSREIKINNQKKTKTFLIREIPAKKVGTIQNQINKRWSDLQQ